MRRLDTAAASAAPGVVRVITAADLQDIGPIPCTARIPTDGPLHVPFRGALARGRVRHVGEPLAAVVAETATAARDAAELIEADYDPLPCVTEAADALRLGAPAVWADVPGNLAFTYRKGDAAAAEAALAGAAHVVELLLVNNRVIVAPLEHRAVLARYDEAEGFDLVLSGSGAHQLRDNLADSVFHVKHERMHVSIPDVGGGFGVKNPLYPEPVLCLWAARALGCPVRWASDHGEDFVSTAHGRDNLTRARLGLDADGRFLALHVDVVANLGAFMSTGGPGPSTTAPGNAMGGGYDIPHVAMVTRGAFTNTVPLDAYRGAGKPEANYLIERLVEAAAHRTGIDGVELRRRNLVQRFPHATAVATTIASGRFARNIDPALARADAAGFPARRAASFAAGRLRGLGVCCFLETARGAFDEGAAVHFMRDGRVSLRIGTHSNGQGHETVFPRLLAERLGVPEHLVDFVQADTRLVRRGNGHGGARSLHMGGTALVATIGAVLDKARPVAARLLQARAEELAFAGGRWAAGGRSVALMDVAEAAADAGEPIDTWAWTPQDRITFPNGVHVAEVEVDPDTGSVSLLRYTAADDFGTVVDPVLLLGQIQGGLAQGIGQALCERTVFDPGSGQLLTGSFMDYAMPRASDLPPFAIDLLGEPTAANPLGVKGAGQAGAIAAPQTAVCAVLDALRPIGVAHLDMPLTPERVWQAIRTAGRQS